jgi:glc operon protein GlcG
VNARPIKKEIDMKAFLITALGLAAVLSAEAPKPGNITYIESSRVAAAFAKGIPLIEAENYKVHASHRDGPGMLITGGEAVDTKTIATEEIRGASIRGGSERRLVKGDVIIIPNGVPHWFKEVPGSLNYYVVKVRSEK